MAIEPFTLHDNLMLVGGVIADWLICHVDITSIVELLLFHQTLRGEEPGIGDFIDGRIRKSLSALACNASVSPGCHCRRRAGPPTICPSCSASAL